jgi:hypothetical protein
MNVIYDTSFWHAMFLISLNSRANNNNSLVKQLTHDSKSEGLNPSVAVASTRHCETNLNVCFEALEHFQLRLHNLSWSLYSSRLSTISNFANGFASSFTNVNTTWRLMNGIL